MPVVYSEHVFVWYNYVNKYHVILMTFTETLLNSALPFSHSCASFHTNFQSVDDFVPKKLNCIKVPTELNRIKVLDNYIKSKSNE